MNTQIVKDVTGKVLSVGDKIAYIPQGGYTYALELGIIIAFTKAKIKIQPGTVLVSDADVVYKFPEQVAKV
jgi:hypothetical protein